MKIILPIIFSFVLIPMLKAQPLVNSVNPPGYGTTVSYKFKEDATLDPGLAGEQTWDFSTIDFSGTSSISSVFVEVPSNQVFSFSTATFAKEMTSNDQDEEVSDGDYFLYELNNLNCIVLGNQFNSPEQRVIYSDPKTLIRYPITYNNTPQTDNFAYQYTYNYLINVTGTISTVYDGYGTLKTSKGTYENVIRIKTTETKTKTTDNGTPEIPNIQTVNITIITYSWRKPDQFIPIFEIKETTTSAYITTVSKKANLYDAPPISAITPKLKQTLTLTVGPNPASEKISIDFKDVESGNYDISITDYQGVSLMNEQKFIGNGDLHSLDISTLKSGFYIVKIMSDKAEFVKKLIKY
jgi:hypothetical protein